MYQILDFCVAEQPSDRRKAVGLVESLYGRVKMENATTEGAKGPSAKKQIVDGFCFFKGQLMPMAEATVGVATHGLNYGTGCFEGIRGYWNPSRQQLFILKAREHYDRFKRSAHILRISIPYTTEQLVEWTQKMLVQNHFQEDVYIRPLAFKGGQVIKVGLSGISDDLAIFATPMGNYVPTQGLQVTISSWQRIADNIIPSRAKVTGAYINAALASDAATADGYDEAIMLGQDGHVSEGSSSNLFMVRSGRLVTPPITSDILEGVTREAIFQLAADLGIPVDVRPIDRTELYVADELFLSGTGAQVAGIVGVDRRQVGSGETGPVTKALQDRYFHAVRGDNPQYDNWLTPVY